MAALAGAWPVREGALRPEQVGGGGAGVLWRDHLIPGGYASAGFVESWWRRSFQLPNALEGSDLYLMLPSIRDAAARVFINGH